MENPEDKEDQTSIHLFEVKHQEWLHIRFYVALRTFFPFQFR